MIKLTKRIIVKDHTPQKNRIKYGKAKHSVKKVNPLFYAENKVKNVETEVFRQKSTFEGINLPTKEGAVVEISDQLEKRLRNKGIKTNVERQKYVSKVVKGWSLPMESELSLKKDIENVNYLLTQAVNLAGIKPTNGQKKFKVNVKVNFDTGETLALPIIKIMYVTIQKSIPIEIEVTKQEFEERKLMPVETFKRVDKVIKLINPKKRLVKVDKPALICIGYKYYFTKECINHYINIVKTYKGVNTIQLELMH
jgi:hypothetical protein